MLFLDLQVALTPESLISLKVNNSIKYSEHYKLIIRNLFVLKDFFFLTKLK